ncbi:hypothetical protein N8089_01945 [Flavobacteriales bacterium]|jgi:hypothetical protein|nr:hypothetical protein [Flavobacteriales bacterium]
MKTIDRYFIEHPYRGVEQMADYLRLDKVFIDLKFLINNYKQKKELLESNNKN